MSVEKPTNASELFNFYYKVVKPIYTAAQTDNRLPVEILFEIHAALDHLSRQYRPTSPETESQCIDRAFGHFKRGCLDVFKLRLKKCTDQYDALNAVDLSVIDNGEFYGRMIRFHGEIATEAEEARNHEGEFDRGFDNWLPVFKKCIEFEKEYFQNAKVEWARKRQEDAQAVEARLASERAVAEAKIETERKESEARIEAERIAGQKREDDARIEGQRRFDEERIRQERKRGIRYRLQDVAIGVVGSFLAALLWKYTMEPSTQAMPTNPSGSQAMPSTKPPSALSSVPNKTSSLAQPSR